MYFLERRGRCGVRRGGIYIPDFFSYPGLGLGLKLYWSRDQTAATAQLNALSALTSVQQPHNRNTEMTEERRESWAATRHQRGLRML